MGKEAGESGVSNGVLLLAVGASSALRIDTRLTRQPWERS